jgi:hypothetical protein
MTPKQRLSDFYLRLLTERLSIRGDSRAWLSLFSAHSLITSPRLRYCARTVQKPIVFIALGLAMSEQIPQIIETIGSQGRGEGYEKDSGALQAGGHRFDPGHHQAFIEFWAIRSEIVHKRVPRVGYHFPDRRAFFIFAVSAVCTFFIAVRETASTLFV